MPRPVRLGILAAELAALDVACMALHAAARLWHGKPLVEERIRKYANEMAARAKALRRAAYEV